VARWLGARSSELRAQSSELGGSELGGSELGGSELGGSVARWLRARWLRARWLRARWLRARWLRARWLGGSVAQSSVAQSSVAQSSVARAQCTNEKSPPKKEGFWWIPRELVGWIYNVNISSRAVGTITAFRLFRDDFKGRFVLFAAAFYSKTRDYCGTNDSKPPRS
jgi:hypothetical protein